MAQRGGTYTVSKEPKPSPQPKTSSNSLGQDDTKNENQQWELVTTPTSETDPSTQDERNVFSHKVSSHFDLKIGWGKWKITLLNWDSEFKTRTSEIPRRQTGDAAERSVSQGGVEGDEGSKQAASEDQSSKG